MGDSILNPLIQDSPIANRAIPFDQIKEEHFKAAFETALNEGRQAINSLVESQDEPSFENVIVALEESGNRLDYVSSVFFNLLHAHGSDNMHQLAQEISPKLAEFSNDVSLNKELFEKVKAVYDKRDTLKLAVEEKTLLENSYKSFVRNGALLNDEDKKKLREIDAKKSRLSPQFSENVLKQTNAVALWIDDENDLAGIPEAFREAAAEEAKARGDKAHGKWLFTLQAPSYIPFMKYADKESLRKSMWMYLAKRCYGGEFDNRNLVKEIVSLRHQRAKLLGFSSHADYVLAERMAQNKETVKEFIEKIIQVSKPAAEKELMEVKTTKKELGDDTEFQPWDVAYYSEKLKQKKYSFDEEKLRPFFKLENVINGVFKHAELLYGLEFKEASQYPVYHPEVKAYEVWDRDTKKFVGLFYADFFPRDSKKGGAWMTVFRDQGLEAGQVHRPHVAIVCNFTKSTQSKPSLLSLMEVHTLFHEFGHALHGLLSQCRYRSLSGTNVYWDFVELPSQIMENWLLEKEALALFARHYETGELIPDEYIEKIVESSKFMAGSASLRQAKFAWIDLNWHNADRSDVENIEEFEKEKCKNIDLFPHVNDTSISCSFSHIFAGGYSSGYYSYKWAEVLDADAFELFKEKGVFNTEVSYSFRDNILSKGGSEHPMELYKRFRGREPDPNALFKREGLL